jgi:aspartyl-tRNA(Asn)/glutamyl-tRNA(Gln) amidotransferase subunit A
VSLLGPEIPAWRIADAVRRGEVGAVEVVEATLDRIAAGNPRINAFTDVTAARARAEAAAIDARRRAGEPLGPLAGVPYAVKNLYDVAGLATRAGSKINRGQPAAAEDAALVQRLRAAGAVLVGALNMGEYAYDFTGENIHDGDCLNPHDVRRIAGGSSSGSAAAVAAGLVPLTLGSDTNGSIRVPASFCGVFGLKPTYGRLSRRGTFPFCDSLDHLGPLARSARDLALAFDALQGFDGRDPAQADVPPLASLRELGKGIDGLRIAVLGGHFGQGGTAAAHGAVARIARALGAEAEAVLEDAALARAAAYIITSAEAAAFHLERLRTRAGDFDPYARERLLAGATLPAAWLVRAQRVRRFAHDRALALFDEHDLLLAPATPCSAPMLGQRTMTLDGRVVEMRPHLGVFSQPISCLGLPVCAVPAVAAGELPIGVQLIAAPWREDLCLRAAWMLEQAGVAVARLPGGSVGTPANR